VFKHSICFYSVTLFAGDHSLLCVGRVRGNYFSLFFLVCDPKPRSAGNTGSKKSNTKKHQTNDTKDKSNKASDAKDTLPCDLGCQLNKGLKDLWQRITGEKGTYLEDALRIARPIE
jgi:hypothetical protein